MKIAVLGLGEMGSRMAVRLLSEDNRVFIWNRTEARAQPLVQAGAVAAATPRLAAMQAEVIISMVADNEASRAVWCDPQEGALAGLNEGAIAIESSTLTPDWVAELADLVRKTNGVFLDAPVVGSRPQAEAGQLTYLVGGDTASLGAVRPVLDLMGRSVVHVGPVGRGTVLKLMVNALFGIQVASLGELLAFGARAGLGAGHMSELLAQLPVTSVAAEGAASAIAARNFTPQFPIDLVAKDFRYVVEAAAALNLALPTTSAVGMLYEQASDEGFGADNISGVAQLFD